MMRFAPIRGHVLGAAAASILPFVVVAPRSLVLPFAVTVLLLGLRLGMERTRPAAPPILFRYLGASLALGLVSALWAVVPAETLTKIVQLASVYFSGWIIFDAIDRFDDKDRDRVETWTVYGLLFGTLFLLFETMTKGMLWIFLNGLIGIRMGQEQVSDFAGTPVIFKNAATVLSAMIWPALPALKRRWGWLGVAASLAAILFLLVRVNAHTALLAFLAGTAVFAAAHVNLRLAIGIAAAGVAALFLLMPVLPRMLPAPADMLRKVHAIPNSAHHRLNIWLFTSEKIFERPLLGWGLHGSRSIPGGKEKVRVYIEIPGRTRVTALEERLPLHPHNGILQIWLELGVPGALLGLGFVLHALWKIPAVFPDGIGGATAAGAVVTLFAIANSSFGLWQSWWMGTIFLIVALLLILARRPGDTQGSAR